MESCPNDQPPSIPGIDSVEFLERIGEDLDLFWDLLGEFSGTYRDTPAQIAVALGPDPATAKQLTHTLKGVLGNLAATELFPICQALDDAIREGRTQDYPALLATLSQGVPALCDAIRSARAAVDPGAPASHGGAPPPPGSGSDWPVERYSNLLAALRGNRARDCKTLADELAATGEPAAVPPFFSELHALIRAYRFPEAQDLLERHLARLGGAATPVRPPV
ncbi:MAG TPA: Hpt domain-containing protein [Lamprocystis sp. (in: g-proteobacteria)]|nr:Hpt domain-containing protein [Lamprocystis sp. (in: g-proteobacteria)]